MEQSEKLKNLIVVHDGNTQGNFKKSAWLSQVYKANTDFDKGAGRAFWYDGSIITPLLALSFETTFVNYDETKGRQSTDIYVYDEENQRVVCCLVDELVAPPPGSVCIKFDGSCHYEHIRLKDKYRAGDMHNTLLRSKIQGRVKNIPLLEDNSGLDSTPSQAYHFKLSTDSQLEQATIATKLVREDATMPMEETQAWVS